MMKVLFWSPGGFLREPVLAAFAEVDGIEVENVATVDDVVRSGPGADMLVLPDAPEAEARQIVEAIEQPGSRVRALHFVSAGRDGFERAGLPERVEVTDSVGAGAATAAEHAVALLLALTRRVPGLLEQQQRHVWDRVVAQGVRSLEGQTVLIVGLGHIGRGIAERLRPFGPQLIGLQHTPRHDESVDVLGVLADLDSFLPKADVVVLSLAATPETYRIVDADRLARFKQGALLVNIARGTLVDHDALDTGLREGLVGGAALDVTDPEPFPADHPLWDAPNVVIAPHIALTGGTESFKRIARRAADRVAQLVTQGTMGGWA